MASVNTPTQMVLSTRDIGLMISNTVRAKKSGPMVLNMKATTSSARRMVSASSYGQTCQATVVTSEIITFMDMANTNGLMGVSSQATGLTTKCMVAAYSLGQMVESIKVSTLMTRRPAMVCSLGLMVGNTTECGEMESKKGQVSTTTRDQRFDTESGRTESVLIG